jgi:hypothetical protein
MGRFILISFGLLLALFVVGSIVSGRTNKEVASACRDGKIDPKAILQSWMDVGVIRNIARGDRQATVEVRSKTWETISNSAKISIGLAAYCEVIDNTGRAVVMIEGSRMEALGSVVDGNWFSP